MEPVADASSAMTSTLEAMETFAYFAECLAEVLQESGNTLQKVLGDFVLTKDLVDDAKVVAEFFTAWREVGEVCVTMSTRLTALGSSARQESKQADGERKQRLAEAARLQQALENADRPQAKQGWTGWFGRGSGPTEASPDSEVMKKRLQAQRDATNACLEHLAEQPQGAKKRTSAALGEVLLEARRHAKALGERIATLRPSWKGSSLRVAASNSISVGSGTGGGKVVKGLIRSMSTIEGKQKLKESHDQHVAIVPQREEEEQLTSPPADSEGPGAWWIHGVYEHQVLKAGLRLMADTWPMHDINKFPRGKNGNAVLLREKLMGDLISGKIQLQSVLGGDVAAAQRDLQKLSLTQLLRLRALHLDFTPSGCGADTVHAVGATHEAFVGTLDGLLFQGLGRKAAGDNIETITGTSSLDASDSHRLGREAVLMFAGAASVSSPGWWCWWATDSVRLYFHPGNFASSRSFPSEGGVLEINDKSRRDVHEPSGRLRWFDWHLAHVTSESALSPVPLRGASTNDGSNSITTADTCGSSSGSPAKASTSPTKGAGGSVGAATAGMFSPEVLRDLRTSLRKTGGPSVGPAKPQNEQGRDSSQREEEKQSLQQQSQ